MEQIDMLVLGFLLSLIVSIMVYIPIAYGNRVTRHIEQRSYRDIIKLVNKNFRRQGQLVATMVFCTMFILSSVVVVGSEASNYPIISSILMSVVIAVGLVSATAYATMRRES